MDNLYNLEINNKTDRGLVLYDKLNNDLSYKLEILFSKYSNVFQVKPIIEVEHINSSIYRNLENIDFYKYNLNLYSVENDKMDYKFKYLGLNKSYENTLNKELYESYLLNSKTTNNINDKNILNIYRWSIRGYEDQNKFWLIERIRYDRKLNKKYIRTSGVEIYRE